MTLVQRYGNLEIFHKFLFMSVAFHTFMILILSVNFNLSSDEEIRLPDAIRVDMIALPDKVKAQKRPAVKKQKTVKLKKVKKKNIKKNIKKKQQRAIKQLQAFAALEKLKNKESKKEIKSKSEQGQPKKKEFKGNVISTGASLDGLNRLSYDKYLLKVKEHLKSKYNIPAYLSNLELKTEIALQIDNSGFIVSKKIISTSGNNLFDQLALTAVDNSSPLPEPPERLKSILSKNSFILSFP
jgi:outer membrane biosynthesis protein TonB